MQKVYKCDSTTSRELIRMLLDQLDLAEAARSAAGHWAFAHETNSIATERSCSRTEEGSCGDACHLNAIGFKLPVPRRIRALVLPKST